MQMPLGEILCLRACLCAAACHVSHRSEVSSENLSQLSFGEFDWRLTSAMQLSYGLHINTTFA